MYRPLFAIAFRNFKTNLLYNLFVVGGLSLGMITFLIIFQWVFWQFSFDKSYRDYKNISRMTLEYQEQNTYMHTARLFAGEVPLALRKTDRFPEIESLIRISPYRQAVVRVGENSFYENNAYSCDKEILDFFPLKVLRGNPENLFEEPHSIVLTESTAKKYFGDEDPLDKEIEMVNQYLIEFQSYTVTGVIQDFPENSHFNISVLTPIEDPDVFEGTCFVYTRLVKQTNTDSLEARISRFIDNDIGNPYSSKVLVHFQKISDIHLKSHKSREMKQNSSLFLVIILLIGGILVFMLAWFNYALLSHSQKHLSIKRYIIQWQCGAGKKDLYLQTISENLFLGAISLFLTIIIFFLVKTSVRNYLDFDIFNDTRISILGFGFLLFFMLLSILVTTGISTQGLYASIKDRFLLNKPSGRSESFSGIWFIRFVIATEFIITFVLLSNLTMVREQTEYSIAKQMGSNDTTTIQIPKLPRYIVNDYFRFKETLLQYPQITDVTATANEPTSMSQSIYAFSIDGKTYEDMSVFYVSADTNFLSFYNIPIIAGRNFINGFRSEDSTDTYILNETAARMINYDDPESLIGSTIDLDVSFKGFILPGKIVGICEDFKFDGPTNIQQPMVICPKHWWLYCFSVRFNGNSTNAVRILEKTWKELYPGYPLNYYFTTDMYEKLYKNELFTVKLLTLFSIISLIIAGSGLFALSGYFNDRKMFSAALRKVNGADVKDLLLPELKYYLFLSVISTMIAIPISLLLFRQWKPMFSDQIPIPLWLFPICFIFLTLFSWLAVFYHSLRLSRSNPIDILHR